ncbi:maleylpyruvate isomerase family mycothiol-dependent enzyme [Cellulosimicrobium cellulans]|uniref:maleylpyruvate isomerase family mycothiol-dependent enzyme n=1 Tax=Cellulosimicrobium cellulans TaxID=1710 RepID=UPI000848ED92|nr:maleylpyruvate isomerase family mycothiol-dependent enzyme [Cellulosimicrobium cellulans]
MDTFAAIADERRRLADQLADLTPEQRAAQSLCDAWTVHDVLAHLTMPLDVGMARFALAMVLAAGDFDRANRRLTRRQAARPYDEIIGLLRRRADSRFTPPGEGPEAPLTDVLVHGLDIRWPLGLPYDIPEDRAATALDAVMRAPSGVVAKGVVDGLRFEATDIDWQHGTGPTVSGSAAALLLSVTGRAAAVDSLVGDGVVVLRRRIVR